MLVDHQTFQDLEVFGCRDGSPGIFDLLDTTSTDGGRARLAQRFRAPLTDAAAITRTQDALRFIAEHAAWLTAGVDQPMLTEVERYLSSNYEAVGRAGSLASAVESLWVALRYRAFVKHAADGIAATGRLLRAVQETCARIDARDPPPELARLCADGLEGVAARAFRPVVEAGAARRLPVRRVLALDRLIRAEMADEVRSIARVVHELDALVSMAAATRRHGLTFPQVVEEDGPLMEIDAVRHPFVREPVSNDLRLARDRNLIFLTGPNMAGKTTYLKACGLAVYLAHLGMGVPARAMRLAPVECLFSSITTTDNLRAGYSYFYSEVRRVKQAAEILAGGTSALVLFDEVFKGTNVKDAYDACRAVVTGFAGCDRSAFIIASHLVELAHDLRELPGVRFQCFDAELRDGMPTYSFHLKPGLSAQRLGLVLLERENVLALLAGLAAHRPPARHS